MAAYAGGGHDSPLYTIGKVQKDRPDRHASRQELMPLVRCRKSYGYARTTSRHLAVAHHPEAYFENGGLYDWRGRLLPESASFSGVPFPGRSDREPAQNRTASLRPHRQTFRLRGRLHYWCGRMVTHFGHHLLESLPRLWAVESYLEQDPLFLFWGDSADRLDRPEHRFILDVLAAAGIDRNNILVLDRPAVIDNVVIPDSSFDLNILGTTTFKALCSRIGEALTARHGASRGSPGGDRPIYLSKSRLKTGVSRVVNEEDFIERLQRGGMEIIYPETMSLAEQIGLWKSRSFIAGYLGSQTHTAIFGAAGSSILLNHEDQIFSNQLMIDRLSNRNGLYVYPEGDLTLLGRDAAFHLNFRLSDPGRTAEEFLRLVDAVHQRRITVPPVDLPPRTVDARTYFDEPLGINLSLGRPASQSSVFPPHSSNDDPVVDAANAVSGVFPSDYAFHTAKEDDPWWRVDLGEECEIFEIRVFNRLIIGKQYMRNFRISTSVDGLAWSDVLVKQDDQVFGDQDVPYRWLAARRHLARFVRIALIGQGILHLKQVEVFGQPVLVERSLPPYQPATTPRFGTSPLLNG